VLIEESLKGHECDTRRRIDKDGLIWEFTMPLKDRLIAGARFPAVGACSTSRLSPAVVQAAGNKVLVVEDEPLIAMDIDATLSAAGITVVGPARTIAEARQLLEQHDLHAALLDVNVGGEPIDDVAGTLARNNVPFAFLTGYGRESLPAAHRQAQMLKKPFVAETILAAVGGLLADRGEAQVITLRR
jgi:CheY-like chemotaxis protein